MKIAHGGVEYDFDMDGLEAHELRVIEQHTGMTMPEWVEGLKRGKVDALVAVVFTVKRQAGEDVEWHDLDGLKVADLMEAMAAANGIDVEAIKSGDYDQEALKRGELPMLPAAMNRADRRAAETKQKGTNGTGRSTPRRSIPPRATAAK